MALNPESPTCATSPQGSVLNYRVFTRWPVSVGRRGCDHNIDANLTANKGMFEIAIVPG